MKGLTEPALTIHTLGAFSVASGSRLLSDTAQRAGNVWRLFRYMISFRDKPVPLEKLVDMLWPEGDCVNPVKALYSLMYRLRNLLNTGRTEKIDFILFQHNSYLWNKDVPIWLDTDVFEENCRLSAEPDCTGEKKIALLRDSVSLYKGDYMEESPQDTWVVPLAAYYKRLYLKAVCSLCDLYTGQKAYGDIVAVAEAAIEIDPLEETIHERLIAALIQLGQYAQAKTQYDYIANILYRDLGVQPSERLQALYRSMNTDNEDVQYSLDVIMDNLAEDSVWMVGAFYCDLPTFRQIYRLECRSMERFGKSVFITVLSLTGPNHRQPDNETMQHAMKLLKQVVVSGLRHGDVVTQYSKSQMLVMLTCLTYEDCERVVKRMERRFGETLRNNDVLIAHQTSPLKPTNMD